MEQFISDCLWYLDTLTYSTILSFWFHSQIIFICHDDDSLHNNMPTFTPYWEHFGRELLYFKFQYSRNIH